MIQLILNHTLIFLLALGTIFTFIWLYLHKDSLDLKWYHIFFIAVLHTIWGVLSVKTFAIIEGFGDLSVVGNMSLFGGVFFMPIFYFLIAKFCRKKTAQVFDILTICMIFTVMCARINCLIDGCCFGKLIPGMEGIRWPTRESEIVFYVILLIILGRKVFAGHTHGEIYPIYMISYGVFRFINEWFRFSSSYAIFHPAHIWALITFCLGWSFYTEIKSNKRVGRW